MTNLLSIGVCFRLRERHNGQTVADEKDKLKSGPHRTHHARFLPFPLGIRNLDVWIR
jgi:hypothetical protein